MSQDNYSPSGTMRYSHTLASGGIQAVSQLNEISILQTNTSTEAGINQRIMMNTSAGISTNPTMDRVVDTSSHNNGAVHQAGVKGQVQVGTVGKRLIKVVPTQNINASSGTGRSLFVIKSKDSSNKIVFKSGPAVVNPGPSPSMKLPNSVEQEISDMIKKTSAAFTLKGNWALKSGLLEMTVNSEEISVTSQDKFFCIFCKEKYNQKEGYKYHLQRVSFVLKYNCQKCVAVLTFFNKCALWAHIQSHKDTLRYDNVLSLDPYDFASNPHVYDQIIKSSAETNSKEIMKRVIANTQGIEKCPMCEECVRNLPLHLRRTDPRGILYDCLQCNIRLPNPCSHKAHTILHQSHVYKMCCPECGHTWKGQTNVSLKDVFDHVDSCGHFNRALVYYCECRLSFRTLAEAKKHYLDVHTKPLSKCPTCSVAFTDSKLLFAHWKSNPACAPKGNQDARLGVMCTLCKTVMVQAISAKQHVNKHVSHKPELSWMCFLCSMMFSTANELSVHAEEDHPHKAKRCTVCFRLFCNRKLLVEHIMKKQCDLGHHNLSRCVDMPGMYDVDLESAYRKLFQGPVLTFNMQTRTPPAQSSPQVSQLQRLKSSVNQPITSQSQVFVQSVRQPQIESSPASRQTNKEAGSLPKTQSQQTNKEAGPLPKTQSQQKNKEAGSLPKTPSGVQARVTKVAIRKPASLDTQTVELLDEIEQWMSDNGQEIVPTTAPPSKIKKRSKPKPEKNPPHHLMCGVTPKGLMYQCHPCKIIVTGTSNYIRHMKYHEEKGDCTYGPFCHCSVCDRLIGSNLIMKHLKEHRDKGIIVCCRCQRRDFADVEEAVQHANNLCEYKKIGENVQLNSQPTDTEQTSVIDVTAEPSTPTSAEQEQRREHVHTGPVVSEVSVETSPIPATPPPHTKASLHPCHLCGLAFENVVLRDQHVRKNHGGTRKTYHCLACEKKKIVMWFTSQQSARKHVAKKHRVIQTNLVDRCLKEVTSAVGTGQTLAPPAENKDTETEQGDKGDECSAPKRLRLEEGGDFLCGKCGFSCPSTDRETFKKHINTHNVQNEPQCPECGLCFTVLSAVKRHLYAVHKIKEVDKFLAQNGLQEEEEEEDGLDQAMEEMLPGVRPLTRAQTVADGDKSAHGLNAEDACDVENLECKVCYRSFDTEINLKTHMRTHGMAFIRSKRYIVK